MEAWYRLRVADCLINLATALLAGRVAACLFGRAAKLPAVAWYVALYTLLGPGVLAQTEVWANLFVFAGLYLLLEPPAWSRGVRFLLMGSMAGAAAALKPASCWPLLAAMISWPLLRPVQDKRITGFIGPGLLFLAGFAFINLPLWWWLSIKGALPALKELYDGFIKDYLAQGKAPFGIKLEFYLGNFAYQFTQFYALLFWLIPGLIARRVCSQRQTCWILVIGLAGFAAMWSQGRALNYHHQVLTPAAVLLGTAGSLGVASFIRALPAHSMKLSAVATLPVLLFQLVHNGPRDRSALRWLTGQEPPANYARTFDIPVGNPPPADTVQVAQYIRAHSQSDEKILLWVNESELYVWANRMPANRFIHASGLVGQKSPVSWREQYLLKLSAFPPEYFIVARGSEYTWLGAPSGDAASLLRQWTALRKFVSTRYAPPFNFGHLDVYRLKAKP